MQLNQTSLPLDSFLHSPSVLFFSESAPCFGGSGVNGVSEISPSPTITTETRQRLSTVQAQAVSLSLLVQTIWPPLLVVPYAQ